MSTPNKPNKIEKWFKIVFWVLILPWILLGLGACVACVVIGF